MVELSPSATVKSSIPTDANSRLYQRVLWQARIPIRRKKPPLLDCRLHEGRLTKGVLSWRVVPTTCLQSRVFGNSGGYQRPVGLKLLKSPLYSTSARSSDNKLL